jgi:hypothetical protein
MGWIKFWIQVLILLFGFGLQKIKAQNLVPNSGFENYSQLPCNLNSQLFIQDFLINWLQPILSNQEASF